VSGVGAVGAAAHPSSFVVSTVGPWTLFVNIVPLLLLPWLNSAESLSPFTAAVSPKCGGTLDGMRCAARVHLTLDPAGPRGEQCSRTADSVVCGIPVCAQHRRLVTHWDGQTELLRRSATDEFAAWGVTPSAPFVAEF
jgi:hypothetical protein